MTAVVVSPDEKQPTHHISLSDGINTIGLIAVKPDGTPDITAMRREPYPKSTLNSGGGEGSLSTTKVPYGEVSRSEWFGGLGQLRADADRSKFLIGNNIWALNNRAIVASPRLYKTYIGSQFNDLPAFPSATRTVYEVFGTYNNMFAWRFTPTATGNIRQVSVDFQTIPPHTDAEQGGIGNESRVRLELWSSSADGTTPLTVIDWTDYTKITVPESTTTFRFFTDVSLTAATQYWFVLRCGYSVANNGYIGQRNFLWRYSNEGGSFTNIATSLNGGSAWTALGSAAPPAWEVYQNLYNSGLFFEYKHALYQVVNPAGGGAPKLYLNGDRGVATANTDKTKVIDTTKAWPTDKWKGAFVRIIRGPGEGQWARIVTNTATALTISVTSPDWTTPPFDIAPTTNSEYIITFTGEWQEITGHGMTAPVKHVAVTNEETVYFCFGDAANIRRTRWYNNAGAWANAGWVDETTKADLMIFTWDQEKKSVLWRAVNGDKPYVARATVPAWGTAITWETEIYIGDDAKIKAIIYYDGKLVVRKESSMWAILEGVPDILDLDMSSRYSDEHGINNMALFSPYLLFPFQDKLQRLLGQLGENLGPPTMSQELQGEVVAIAPILGAVIVGLRTFIPQGKRSGTDMGGVSRVMIWKDGAWFPLCELPRGSVLHNLYFQRNDDGRDLLWILANTGTYYIRIPRESDYTLHVPASSTDPYTQDLRGANMMLASSCSLAAGQFDLGNKILNKWWERINYADDGFTYVGYWTRPTLDLFSVQPHSFPYMTWLPPVESNTLNIRVRSRRIGLFFVELRPNGLFEFDGFNLSYLARVNDADMWLVPVNASDYDRDLNGMQEDLTAAQKLAIIDAWSRDVVPITMRSLDVQDDNKRVILGRQPKQYRRYSSSVAGTTLPKEGFYTSLVIYEVT